MCVLNDVEEHMGDVVKVHFTEEQQDLIGTLDALITEADEENIVSIAYAAQTDDGSYEMSFAGDVTHHSMIDALKVLIRALRKDLRRLEEK
jgi:hypothetical protein